MTPEAQIAFFAIVALAGFITSMFAAPDEWVPSVLSSGTIMAFWAINNGLWMLSAIDNWALATDTLFAALSFVMFLAIRRGWALGLAILYGIDVLLDHFQIAGRLGYASWAQVENGIFIVQIMLASYPGWRNVLHRGRKLPSSFG